MLFSEVLNGSKVVNDVPVQSVYGRSASVRERDVVIVGRKHHARGAHRV